jgi:predicted ATPase/serine/threonine protein kinase
MYIPTGTRLDRYEVVRALGAGGMGHVYLCLDTKLDRQVAVKLVSREVASDPQLRARFDREARALLALNHPHVLTVFDVGQVGDTPFLVSEVVDGVDLRRLMDERDLPLEEALRLVEQVASALAAAHAAGIVHRDVKPENVMVRRDGYVKVLDFGVAKLQSGVFGTGSPGSPDLGVTAAQSLVGTVRYMAPEQMRGEPVDQRSDVWSVGVVLYELATGRLPFGGKTPSDVIASVLTAPLQLASEVAPGRVPRALDAVIARALQRDPAARYGSCDELRLDLEAVRQAIEGRISDGGVTQVSAGGAASTVTDSGSWGEIAAVARDVAPAGLAPRHNLPAASSSFVGRDSELASVVELLRRDGVRLLVLTGPGGTGKTRLAIEAARAVVGDFPDGVWMVALAPLRDPDEVPAAIAETLGVQEIGDRTPLQAVEEAMRHRHLLLLLDNFEQVVGAAPALARLLERVPGLELLVTSREVLRLRGEHDVALPPLGLPQAEELPPLEALARVPAVALFLSRARALVPTFRLDAGNAPAIAELCRRLDGLPLAIELAAARVRVLAPAAMLRRLDDRFRLLSAGAADLPERHRTLRSTLDWGYDLLGEDERRLFRRLSVFRGPFALAAAEAVCAGGEDPAADLLDPLQSLVDKSLVQLLPASSGEPRFALLETIREYGRARLEPAELEAVRRRHLEHFLNRVEAAVPELAASGATVSLDELALVQEDLRAALERALADDDPEPALRLTGALWWFWYLRGHYREGRRSSEAALSRQGAERSPARARTLLGAGVLAFLQCDYAVAEQRLAAAAGLARLLGARAVLATSRQFSGSLARERGDYGRAVELHGESLSLWREMGEPGGEARSLNYLAFASWLAGDHAAAAAYGEDTVRRFRSLDDREGLVWSLLNRAGAAYGIGDLAGARSAAHEALNLAAAGEFKEGTAWALDLLGRMALREDHPGRAGMLLQRSLRLHRELGDRWRMSSVLEALAAVARARGAFGRAARLEGGATALRQQIGTPLPPAERADWERGRDEARAALGEERWVELARQGAQLDLDRIVAYGLEIEASADVVRPPG